MNSSLVLRCKTCGMPLAEGPLNLVNGELVCEAHTEEAVGSGFCDFCTDPLGDEWYLYDANPLTFAAEGMAIVDFGQQWIACAACNVMVIGDEVLALVDRIMAVRGTPPPDVDVDDLKEVLRTYFVIVLGAVKRPPFRRKTNEQ